MENWMDYFIASCLIICIVCSQFQLLIFFRSLLRELSAIRRAIQSIAFFHTQTEQKCERKMDRIASEQAPKI